MHATGSGVPAENMSQQSMVLRLVNEVRPSCHTIYICMYTDQMGILGLPPLCLNIYNNFAFGAVTPGEMVPSHSR